MLPLLLLLTAATAMDQFGTPLLTQITQLLSPTAA